MLNLENKVIAITGASSGIGEATAKLLAETGAKVVLGARRLEKIVEEIQPGRLSRIQSCESLIARIGKRSFTLPEQIWSRRCHL